MNSAIWIANIENPLLLKIRDIIRGKRTTQFPDTVAMNTFRVAGDRYCLVSATSDCNVLRVNSRIIVASSHIDGASSSSDCKLQPAAQPRFAQGNTVYKIVLQDLHQIDFTYAALR